MSLKLVRRKGTGQFYIRGTVRGQNIFETTRTDNHEIAEAIRIKREAELLHRSVFGASATISFAEAAVSYLTAGGEARYLGSYDEDTGKWNLLIGEFANVPIARIGQVEADDVAEKPRHFRRNTQAAGLRSIEGGPQSRR